MHYSIEDVWSVTTINGVKWHLFNWILIYRLTSGSPGIIVAVNPSNETLNVDFEKDLSTVSGDLTVKFISSSFDISDYKIG